MTREETIQFIDYLMKKENVVVDEYIIRGRNPYNNRVYFLMEVLEKIKKCDNAETAYKKTPMIYTSWGTNCLHKLFPQISYLEDLDEYLAALNIEESERKNYLRAAGGMYKNMLKKKEITPLEGDIHLYLKASKHMLSREFFSRRFPTEYNNFLQQTKGN